MTSIQRSLRLSVIVPAYNEEARIAASLEKLARYLRDQSCSWEVIVVDDGSDDGTGAIVREWAARNRGFRLETIAHAGKGAAVRHGMRCATGSRRFMCDADLAMPLQHLGRFVEMIDGGWDIAIASRQTTGARRVGERRLRYLFGRIFNTLVRTLFVGGFTDTQCGFKCFRGEVADVLFGMQRSTGWTFDVEILCLARQRSLRVVEIPIECHHDRTRVATAFRMALVMLYEIAVLKWRSGRGAAHRRDDETAPPTRPT